MMIKGFQINKIIALADNPVTSIHAASWADQIADTFKAQVVLYDAISTVHNSMHDSIIGNKVNAYSILLQASMSRMKSLSQQITRAQKVRYISELGVSKTNMLNHVSRENVDLMLFNVPKIEEQIPDALKSLLYGSPCPVFFTRLGQQPEKPRKILVPVRLKPGLEQKMPVVIAWAKACNAIISLVQFEPYSSTTADTTAIENLSDLLYSRLKSEGISVERMAVRGLHFGDSMLECVSETNADMIAVVVQPEDFRKNKLSSLMGKYFMECSPVPVLAVPIQKEQSPPC